MNRPCFATCILNTFFLILNLDVSFCRKSHVFKCKVSGWFFSFRVTLWLSSKQNKWPLVELVFYFLVKQPHAKIKDCPRLLLCVKMSDMYSKNYKLRVQKN